MTSTPVAKRSTPRLTRVSCQTTIFGFDSATQNGTARGVYPSAHKTIGPFHYAPNTIYDPLLSFGVVNRSQLTGDIRQPHRHSCVREERTRRAMSLVERVNDRFGDSYVSTCARPGCSRSFSRYPGVGIDMHH